MQKLRRPKRKPKNVVEQLTFARQVLEPKEAWVQGHFYLALGEHMEKVCALGALRVASAGLDGMPKSTDTDKIRIHHFWNNNPKYMAARNFLDEAANKLGPYGRSTIAFNDSETATHERVLALFDEAIAEAKKQCGGEDETA